MLLEGSCHCWSVRFRVESTHPYPFNICYCGICRKTAGSGGIAVNLGASSESLDVEGTENITVYRARIFGTDGAAEAESPAERNFCSKCGSPLWLWDPRWPDLIHHHPVSTKPCHTHISRVVSIFPWVTRGGGGRDLAFGLWSGPFQRDIGRSLSRAL